MTDRDIARDRIRMERGPMLAALGEAGVGAFRGNKCRCPWHEDRMASANIFQTESGCWRFKCHTCAFNAMDVFDVLAKARNKSVDEILSELTKEPDKRLPTVPERMDMESGRKSPKVYLDRESLKNAILWSAGGGDTGNAKIHSHYTYTDINDKPIMRVFRCETRDGNKVGKSFAQARPEGGGWVLRAPEGKLPIYCIPKIAKASTVIVVEGEKAADAGNKVFEGDDSVCFTTSPGGAGKGKCESADWTPLAGKTVYLWPDNDTPDPKTGINVGETHMKGVGAVLDTVKDCSVYWIDPGPLNLPPKGDVVEYIQEWEGAGKEELKLVFRATLDNAEPCGSGREAARYFRDMRSGKYQAVDWKWRALTLLTRSKLPGTVTCVCGDPGSTKSFLMIEDHAFMYEKGIPNAIFMLEDPMETHITRAVAQRDQNESFTDPEWHRKNPQASLETEIKHRSFIDGFSKCLWTAPDEMRSLDEISEWLYERCKEGRRVITIDPITAAATGNRPWVDDLNFLMRAKTIVRQFGASLNLVTHPRKGNGKGGSQFSMNDLAGGAAYQRFSHTVLWLKRLDKPKRVRVSVSLDPMDDREEVIDREMQLCKTRNARGAGLRLGLQFEPKSLRFIEKGTVIEEIDDSESQIL